MPFVNFPGKVFPYGTHVYREPHQDQEELLADLPLLKSRGFNMIKIQESWNIDEPREGSIDLSRIDRVIARAGELGLGVYLGLTMQQAPAWLWRKYPDCRPVYASGLVHHDPTQYTLPNDGKPGPCWDHPGARAAGEAFIAALVKELGSRENIWVWNVFQEIGSSVGDHDGLALCYCQYTLAAFHAWLKGKYGTLDCLNTTWRSGFGSWDEIEPPRRFPAVPITIDWWSFMENEYVCGGLAWQAAAIKRNDPLGRPVFSHVATPLLGRGAEWRWAEATDFFGRSVYPHWFGFHAWDDDAAERLDPVKSAYCETLFYIGMLTDYNRSACRDRINWGAEFQGGPISTHLHRSRDPRPDEIRRWVLAGLGAGMNGISFWNHRPEISWAECNGFGLLDARGGITERAKEAGRIGRAINRYGELFSAGVTPRAQAAILINDDLYHFCLATHNEALTHLQLAIQGYYSLLWNRGVTVDFIDDRQVADGALDTYGMAVLPFPIALDKAYFARLAAFVRRGGFLVSDACPGRFDRLGFCPRGQMVVGAEELFGVVNRDVSIVKEPDDRRWTPPERTAGDFLAPAVLEGVGPFAGCRIRASFYLQTLTPVNATEILRFGDLTAATMHRFGEGTAVLIGTMAGHGVLAHRLATSENFFSALFGLAGLTGDKHGALIRRKRVFGDREAWFFANPTARRETAIVDFRDYRLVADLLGDTVTGRADGGITVAVEPVSLGCVIVER